MSRRDRYIHLRVSKRGLARALTAVLIVGAGYAVWSETMTLTTYYPAPAGVYKRLAANFMQMKAYSATPANQVGVCTDAGMAAPCLTPNKAVPDAGQMFYNKDRDSFYFASGAAQAGQPSTWYKPMSGFAAQTVAAASLASYPVPSGTNAVHGWSAVATQPPTQIVGGGKVIRGALQSSGGLFSLELAGTYCTTDHAPSAPTLMLYWRRWNSGGASSWSLVSSDSTPDPTDLDSSGCAQFSLSGLVSMGVARNGIDGLVKIRQFDPTGTGSLSRVTYTLTKVLEF